MTFDHLIRYQAESVARAKLPPVMRHTNPVKQPSQQTTGAAA